MTWRPQTPVALDCGRRMTGRGTGLRTPRPGMHWKGSGPSSRWAGGWRRLPKRLGAVTVGYKCH